MYAKTVMTSLSFDTKVLRSSGEAAAFHYHNPFSITSFRMERSGMRNLSFEYTEVSFANAHANRNQDPNSSNYGQWAWNPTNWTNTGILFTVGSSGNNMYGNVAFGNIYGPMSAVGYNNNQGFGFGTYNFGTGQTNMYYPWIKGKIPEQGFIDALDYARNVNQTFVNSNAKYESLIDEELAMMIQQIANFEATQNGYLPNPALQNVYPEYAIITGVAGLFKSLSTKGATSQYDKLVKEAQQRYPKLANKTHDHHIRVQYMGGPKNGPTAPLNGSYHQVITNEFRNHWGYGKGFYPQPSEFDRIHKLVYKKLPLPPGYFY